LRTLDWSTILPSRRTSPWNRNGATLPTAPFIGATRNFENAACDERGGVGYGIVLSDGTHRFEEQTAIPMIATNLPLADRSILGTFTLWVRRPLRHRQDGTFQDFDHDEALILTSEGTAPYSRPAAVAGENRTLALVNRAVRVMEVQLSADPGCGQRSGQTGGGAEGSGHSCSPVGDDALGSALTGTAGAGALTQAGGLAAGQTRADDE
jgi:hypothetical protein